MADPTPPIPSDQPSEPVIHRDERGNEYVEVDVDPPTDGIPAGFRKYHDGWGLYEPPPPRKVAVLHKAKAVMQIAEALEGLDENDACQVLATCRRLIVGDEIVDHEEEELESVRNFGSVYIGIFGGR